MSHGAEDYVDPLYKRVEIIREKLEDLKVKDLLGDLTFGELAAIMKLTAVGWKFMISERQMEIEEVEKLLARHGI